MAKRATEFFSGRPGPQPLGPWISQNVEHCVPPFQRGYAWEQSEVDDFCTDVRVASQARESGESRAHFFGNVIFVEEQVEGSRRKMYYIIDGQQRMATLCMLGLCMRDAYARLCESGLPKGKRRTLAKRRAKELTAAFVQFASERNERPESVWRLTLSNVDREFFRGILNGRQPKARRKSHERLEQAVHTVREFVASLLDEQSPREAFTRLESLRQTIDEDCLVNVLVVRSKGDAYSLFAAINDRGRTLSNGDLLRAATLELLSSEENRENQERAMRLWDEILVEDASVTDKYLDVIAVARKGTRPVSSELFRDVMGLFFPPRTAMPLSVTQSGQVLESISQLHSDVEALRKLANGKWPYENSVGLSEWDRNRLRVLVKYLGNDGCLPVLLSATALDEKVFAEIVVALERFFFRVKMICDVHATRLKSVYAELARHVESSPGRFRIGDFLEKLRTEIQDRADDEEFVTQLGRLRYGQGGNKAIKYLLVAIEEHWRWLIAGTPGRPKVRDKTRVFDLGDKTTIEHLYPQRPRAGEEIPKLKSWVDNLGNLVVLGDTDNIKNADHQWRQKRVRLGSASILMCRDVAKWRSLSVGRLKKRQQACVDFALRIFAPP